MVHATTVSLKRIQSSNITNNNEYSNLELTIKLLPRNLSGTDKTSLMCTNTSVRVCGPLSKTLWLSQESLLCE